MDEHQFEIFLQRQTEMFAQMLRNNVPAAVQVPAAIPVPQPSSLSLDGDMDENMDFFDRSWTDYVTATGMDQWPAADNHKKVSYLLSVIGEPARKRYFNFELTEEEKASPEAALRAIRSRVVVKRNIIIDRMDFFSAIQSCRETTDEFVTRLKTLAKLAKLGNLEQEFVAFKVVTANKWHHMRSKMLSIEDISLSKAVDMCRAEEIAAKRSQELAVPETVNKLRKVSKPGLKNLRCKFCGERHEFSKGSCPALESEESSEDSENKYEIGKVYDNSDNGGSVLAELDLKFGNAWKSVICEVDTGANTSLIGYNCLKRHVCEDPVLLPSSFRLQSFGGNPIRVLGQVKIPCRRNEKKYRLVLQVADVDHRPLLSAKASRELGFVKFCKNVSFGESKSEKLLNVYRVQAEKILALHDGIFSGYGKFSGTVSLELDDSIPPSIQPPRRVPIAMRNKLKRELENLEREGLVVKETSHTDWVSNLVIVQRNGPESSVRICLDPIPLNKALKRPNLQFTTLDEILPELGKARVFSTADAKKGFWHVVLDEPSSKLTTFWTPFGRYRWTRLPFGIAPAPEIFQIKLQEVIEGLEGVECIADDVLIYGVGDTLEDALINHNMCLEKLLERLESKNVKLNKSKMKLCQTTVKFYGHLLTDEGLKADESKIQAIRNFPVPTNRKEIHRFIGMVNYLSRFIKSLSANLTNLRKLISKSVPWRWTKIEADEFEQVKALVSDIGTLRYYNVNRPLTVECDAICFAYAVCN
ncbi:uncharacterized protein K02A2.6-like [Topomyia yanbarensis]|uniref:uncharacterized protein K02A2.6-like n=1 Tax=Topomyia yanbarensis TaxID=2498891 RepID=UPI00273C9030|nr:uncharacterized protein K02A2.6-like [Topomyia yanbarensis]